MKRKFWNWVRNEGDLGEARTLFLNGEISDETWYGDEVTPQLFKDELGAGSGPITVWINSPGGDVFAAAQIYNMLRDYKGKVTVQIDSLAASAASVIAMAGDEVLMSPVAMLMIHNPAMIAMGEKKDMEQAIAMLSEVKESILNAYEAKTGLRRNKLSAMMDDETWFNAKKAVELGFADKILFEDEKKPEKEEEDPGKPEKPDEDTGEEPDEEEEEKEEKKPPFKQEAMMFSKRAVNDSFISKVSASKRMVTVDELKTRLNLITH